MYDRCFRHPAFTCDVARIHWRNEGSINFKSPRKLCFHLCWCMCLSVCVFVCLFASNIMWKHLKDFHEIYRTRPVWNKKHSGTFWDVPSNPFEYRHFFSEGSVSVSNIVVNEWRDFHKTRLVRYQTRNNLAHSGAVTFNPVDPGSIFLLSRYLFACSITDKRVKVFS